MSLSSADYSCLPELVDQLLDEFKGQKVSVSLPSLRVDSFSVDIAKKVQQVRKSGLTFAPEAGTQRLRDVINKGVTEEDLLAACENAFENGWSTVKLYFMMGLPTENGRRPGRHRRPGLQGPQSLPQSDPQEQRQGHGLRIELRTQVAHGLPVVRPAAD